MRGNAYSNFNQFVQPVRSPNTTLYIPKQVVRKKQQPSVPLKVRNHHLKQGDSYSTPYLQARSPFLTVGKRIEHIKLEKDALLDQLRENDTLERQLLEESEVARKKREEDSLDKIHREVKILKERLFEKEQQERWILDKNRQDKEDHEKRALESVQLNREELLRKITNYETRISEIKDQTEIQKLQQEKEEVTRKWKQIELDEQSRHERDELEKKASILKQKEQREIEQLELERLQGESKQLKSMLESKTNEETWLQRRVGPTESTKYSADGDIADDETTRPHRRITKRRNRRNNNTTTTNDTTIFHSSDRSLEDRFQQLTKEAGTYSTPEVNPPDNHHTTETDYQSIFNNLQQDIKSKQANITSREESNKLEFMYKTLAMLSDFNKKSGNITNLDRPTNTHVDKSIVTGNCGCNISHSSNDTNNNEDSNRGMVSNSKIEANNSILPTHFNQDTDQDSDVEAVRSTMDTLTQMMNESFKDDSG